jgi:glycosyltransferase involved in cell wall biosynthesis
MRIGVFSNTYKPVLSGVVTSVCLFRGGLRELGHEVFVFAPACRGYEDDEEGIFRYPAVDLPETLNASLAVPFSPRISQLIPSLGLDIIHSQHPVIMGKEAVRVARRQQVPLVFTCHGRYEDYSDYVPLGEIADPLVKKAIRLVVADYVNDCDLTICPSQHVQRLLEEYGVVRCTEIIPTPVPLGAIGAGDGRWVRQKYGLGEDSPVLVYVGRLAPEKDLPFLLRAFRQVVTQEPDCRLLLVGSGPEERALRQQVQDLGIGEQVVFCGFVEHLQIPDCLAAADLFVFASRSEAQGLAVIEALAAGLPVIAVRTLATEELLAHGVDSILTERRAAPFAAGVVRLLRDERERNALGEQARRASQRYTMEACARKLEQAYQRLLRGSVEA